MLPPLYFLFVSGGLPLSLETRLWPISKSFKIKGVFRDYLIEKLLSKADVISVLYLLVLVRLLFFGLADYFSMLW